jgi:hypothetical protein
MNNLILEELKTFQKNSNYNPKFTLSENIREIDTRFNVNQQNLSTITEGYGAATAQEILMATGKDLATFKNTLKLFKSVPEITTLLALDAKSFEKELKNAIQADIKSGKAVGGEMGPLTKEISKIDTLRAMKEAQIGKPLVKGKSVALTPDEMDAIIFKVRDANKLKAAKFKMKPIKNPADDANVIVTADPSKKTWNWKRLTKWGLGVGVPIAVLYAIYKMGHSDEPPIVTTDPNLDPNPDPKPNYTSKYTQCPETFPIKMYCKNSTISQVQACLGFTGKYLDGKFGPITSGALVTKGADGQVITQGSIDKVCGTSNTSTDNPWSDYTTFETEDENQDVSTTNTINTQDQVEG